MLTANTLQFGHYVADKAFNRQVRNADHDLPAQTAADDTRLVLFVNTHVFTDAGNLRFDLRKESRILHSSE